MLEIEVFRWDMKIKCSRLRFKRLNYTSNHALQAKYFPVPFKVCAYRKLLIEATTHYQGHYGCPPNIRLEWKFSKNFIRSSFMDTASQRIWSGRLSPRAILAVFAFQFFQKWSHLQWAVSSLPMCLVPFWARSFSFWTPVYCKNGISGYVYRPQDTKLGLPGKSANNLRS